jgi:hypothetical protein
MSTALWKTRRLGTQECFAVFGVLLLCAHAAAAACSNDVLTSQFYGDGYCDKGTTFNTADCGWDGGDCCRRSCTSTATGTCGENDYDCLNPDFSNSVDDFATVAGGRCEDKDLFCAIPTVGVCQFAADLLGLSDTTAGTPISNTGKAPGCFVAVSSGSLRFNSALTSSSGAGTDTNVCIKCAAITTTTTTTTTTNLCNLDCKDAPLYTCSLHECRFDSSIRVVGKGLSGTIPESIGLALSATLTDTLRLDGNQLTGTLPPSLGSLTALKTLCVRLCA